MYCYRTLQCGHLSYATMLMVQSSCCAKSLRAAMDPARFQLVRQLLTYDSSLLMIALVCKDWIWVFSEWVCVAV